MNQIPTKASGIKLKVILNTRNPPRRWKALLLREGSHVSPNSLRRRKGKLPPTHLGFRGEFQSQNKSWICFLFPTNPQLGKERSNCRLLVFCQFLDVYYFGSQRSRKDFPGTCQWAFHTFHFFSLACWCLCFIWSLNWTFILYILTNDLIIIEKKALAD